MDLDKLTKNTNEKLQSLVASLWSNYQLDLLEMNDSELQKLKILHESKKIDIVKNSGFNSYHNNPEYGKCILVLEAIKMLTEIAPKRLKKMTKPNNKLAEGQMAASFKKGDKVLYKGQECEVVKFTRGPMLGLKVDGKIHMVNKDDVKSCPKEASSFSKKNKKIMMEEENLDQAETLLAAKDLSDSLQKMAEQTAKMSVDELMPLVDRMKGQFGQEQANGFNDVVRQHLQTVLDTIIKAKDETDNAIMSLQDGQTPGSKEPQASDIGQNKGIKSPDKDKTSTSDNDDFDFDKEFAAGPETSGPESAPLGRSKKDELKETRMTLKMKITDKDNTAKIYWSKDDEEYVVKFFKNGLHLADADYFTNSIDDAEGTAKLQVKQELTESQKCMECGRGMYEQTKGGKMVCNECGHMMMQESEYHHPMKDYKHKHVRGLYNYEHYEHPDGSWYQLRHGRPYEAVHQDVDGTRIHFYHPHDLKDHIARVHGNAGKNELDETIDMEMHPSRKGMFNDWSMEDLRSELAKTKKQMAGYKDDDKKVPHKLRTKFSQLTFAIRAKTGWGKVEEDTQDYSTQDLENAMKTGKTGDGKPVDRQQAQKVLDARKKSDIQPTQPISEKAVSQAQQRAAGIALAAKKGEIAKTELKGASKDMVKMSKKELEKFAGTSHKGLPEKVDEMARIDRRISKLKEAEEALSDELIDKKLEFAQKVMQGKQKDMLNVGHGLEGDAIEDKLSDVKSQIHEAQLMKKKLLEKQVAKSKQILEARRELAKLNNQLNRKPYAVVGLDNTSNKVKHVFESIEQRNMWLEFHQDTLKEFKLIDPQDIVKAKHYIKTKLK